LEVATVNTQKIDEARATPSAWVDTLDEHDQEGVVVSAKPVIA